MKAGYDDRGMMVGVKDSQVPLDTSSQTGPGPLPRPKWLMASKWWLKDL